MQLVFHSPAYNALANALIDARCYSDATKAECDRLRFLITNSREHGTGQSIRGNPLFITTVTLPVEDAVALLGLLYSTGFGWPIDSVDFDWKDTIVSLLIANLVPALKDRLATNFAGCRLGEGVPAGA